MNKIVIDNENYNLKSYEGYIVIEKDTKLNISILGNKNKAIKPKFI